jgi:hypothetical protein
MNPNSRDHVPMLDPKMQESNPREETHPTRDRKDMAEEDQQQTVQQQDNHDKDHLKKEIY